jgi:hypothetical protein
LLNKELWVFKGTYIGYEYSLKGKNKTMRLLLVEDDIKIALFIKNGLRRAMLSTTQKMVKMAFTLQSLNHMIWQLLI